MEMDKERIVELACRVAPKVVEYRRHIHANPELSFMEYETADYVAGALDSLGVEHRRIAGTGVLAKIEGRGNLTRAVVLRADMDALPVQEATGLKYASCKTGVMHACGHDMHTAALLGVVTVINELKDQLEGTLFALFQPGEEANPGGASLVLNEEPFEGYDVVAVVGSHVDPDLPTGVFGLREGKYMASSDEIRITIRGNGGHAAMPQNLHDPIVAAAAVITALQQVVSRLCNPGMPTVLSIGRVIADGATNIIPDHVFMAGTLRTFDEGWRTKAKENITEIAESTARAYGVEAEVDISKGFPCVVNDVSLTESARRLTAELFGAQAVVALEMRPTAEDFGFYTQRYPSVFYRVGVGGRPGEDRGRLHAARFDPDEQAMEYAVAAMSNLAFNIAG